MEPGISLTSGIRRFVASLAIVLLAAQVSALAEETSIPIQLDQDWEKKRSVGLITLYRASDDYLLVTELSAESTTRDLSAKSMIARTYEEQMSDGSTILTEPTAEISRGGLPIVYFDFRIPEHKSVTSAKRVAYARVIAIQGPTGTSYMLTYRTELPLAQSRAEEVLAMALKAGVANS